MSDIEKARRLFQDAGLAFPTIPTSVAERLMQRGKWLFATREVIMSPYNLRHYVDEIEGKAVDDYALLSHSGHGVNSYAIQYYLVLGPLRIFLHLGWGGVYMDSDTATATVRECFSLADQIVQASMPIGGLGTGGQLRIVGSDFYGSYWSGPGKSCHEERMGKKGPVEVLSEALGWLRNAPG